MTGDSNFSVKKIAVIGGGYSGLSTLADLLHTSANGVSTIKTGVKPVDPAFPTVKLFERNAQIGGVWNYSKESDVDFPNDQVLKTKKYWEPSELLIEQRSKDDGNLEFEYNWNRSAAYDNLYTNISYDFMTLSTLKKKKYPPDRLINPFLTHKEVFKIILDFVEKYQLRQYIQLNSTVQNVTKDSNGKYVLQIRTKNTETGEYNWYTEKFDAIVAASGRTIPHIPHIRNLEKFVANNPGVVSHTKSFRRADIYRDKKVLLVGSSVSSIGVLEYLKPIAREIHVSVRSIRDDDKTVEKYYNNAFNDDGLIQHGEIVDLNISGNEVIFKNGERVIDFDKIIFATGYHIHYPYLDELSKSNSKIVQIGKANGDQRGLIEGLYHYIFTISEPTIAHIGLSSSPFFILLVEAQGSAVAGVWSNAKKLPGLREQEKWNQERLKNVGNRRITNQFDGEESKLEIEFLNDVLGPFERPSPSVRANPGLWQEHRDLLEVIYKRFSSGELDEDYVLKVDTSGL